MHPEAEDWILQLNLQPHPEGGWFAESYHSATEIPQSALPEGFNGPRCYSTAIYFLLTGDIFSAFHRIRADEMWHFYAGTSLTIHQIYPTGRIKETWLGRAVARGECLQAVIAAGDWFAAQVDNPEGYALVGCTVAPGFDYADFELAQRADLTRLFPQHADLIARLTK